MDLTGVKMRQQPGGPAIGCGPDGADAFLTWDRTPAAQCGDANSPWDQEVDVVVVGAGAGGMAAALTASIEGLSVLILEKTDKIGGSTAISGGVVWAPANSHAAATGNPDSPERAMAYLDTIVGDTTPKELQRSFVASARAMVDYFARHTALTFSARAVAPDYYPDKDGAAHGGRALDPVEFDGRSLGPRFTELRDPMPQFLVLGGMMVNTFDVKQLLAVTRSLSAWKHGMRLVLRYARDRLGGYHRGTRLLLGNALAARLFYSVLQRRVPYRLSVSVKQLVTGPAGVEGVRAMVDGQPLSIRARRGVVVACGGFPWNQALRDAHYPSPSGPWSIAPISNTGDGLELAQSAGATLGSGHASAALWAPVSIHRRSDGAEVRFPHLVWERAKPGLMSVSPRGHRFVNEATSYHEFVLAMHRAAAIPAFLVCDQEFIVKWGLGLALPGRRSRRRLIRDGYLWRADSLHALANALKMDPQALAASAAQFNAAAVSGVDEAFGKGGNAYNRYLGDAAHQPNPCLGPLAKAPFYAIAVYPGDIGTALGIRCDQDGQALDQTGKPLGGLYAVGNDMHSVMGGHYPGPGITLGPALTFGWRAGLHLARSADHVSVNANTELHKA